MAQLVILYRHPDDPDTFESYYAEEHLPFANEHMPGVQDADMGRVVDSPGGAEDSWYRYAVMTFASLDDLRAAITSDDGRRVLADLETFATGGYEVLVTHEG